MSLFQGAAQGAMAGSSLGPWGAVGGAVIGGLSGLFGSRSAKKAAQRAEQEDRERRAGQAWGADQYNTLGNRYGEDSRFVATGVRTPYASTSVDENGNMVASLDPRYEQYRGDWDNLFRSEYGRMMNFDPEALAADRYKKMQSLVLPGREEQLDTTQGMMLRRGLIGSTATGANGTAQNPLYNALARSWGDEDTKMGLESMNFADNRRTQGLNMLTGMFGNIQGIDRMADAPLEMSRGWSGMMNTHNLNALNGEYGFYGQGVDLGVQSRMPGSFVRQAQNASTATNAAGASAFLNQMPQLIGMFGRGSAPAGGIGGGGNGMDNPYGIGAWNTNN